MLRKIASLVLSSVIAFSSFALNTVFAEDSVAVRTSEISKTVAFPGAQGGGMYTSGARGAVESGKEMEVYHVTSLANKGEGSFREAVSRGNRIIVFDVSGYIDLEENVTIGGNGKNNITILGQTAPGDGICFRGNNIKVSGENIILRYIRFRVGDKLADGNQTRTQDGLEFVDNTKNVIIDHCSVSWGTDENLTAYAVKDVTIQNCIIAEALNHSIHAKDTHSYAAIWGGINLSVYNNLIATHKSRNPKIGTSETTAMTAGYNDWDTVVDIRNNVIYNWQDKAGYGSENGAGTNIVNNVYRPGPATGVKIDRNDDDFTLVKDKSVSDKKKARIFEYSTGNKYGADRFGKIYANGNIIDISDSESDTVKAYAQKVNENNYQPAERIGVFPDEKYSDDFIASLQEEFQPKYLEEPIPFVGNVDYSVADKNAEDVYKYVIENAGAFPRDKVDTRIIKNVEDRTAPNTPVSIDEIVVGSKLEKSYGLVDTPADGIPKDAAVGDYDDRGYPVFNGGKDVSRDAEFDSDKDGIADVWEDKMGLDKTNPKDSINIGPNGLTWLEIYAEDIGKNTFGNITINIADKIVTQRSADIALSVPADSAFSKFEVYCDGKMIKEETASNQTTINVSDLPLGENYITVKALKDDGIYSLSNTQVVYVIGENYGGELTDASDAEGAKVFEDNGRVYTYVNGEKLAILQKENIEGDFLFTAKSDYVSNLVSGVETGISISSGDKIVKLYRIYEGNKIVMKKSINGVVSEAEGIDVYGSNMFNIEKNGDNIILQAGSSASMLKDIATVSLDKDLGGGNVTAAVYAKGVADKITVSEFTNVAFIDNDKKTNPKIELKNLKDRQLLNLTQDIKIEVTPDAKAKVNEIVIMFGDNIIEDLYIKEGISSVEERTIPVKFSGATEGDLRIICFDENLGRAEKTVKIAVSDEVAPWESTNIGGTDTDMPTYISFNKYEQDTLFDYTYKINSPEGNISGTSDKYGYMYQKFNNDMRIYYRSRMQSSKDFGIMLKENASDADGVSYFFGAEKIDGKNVYSLKARKTKGGEYEIIKTIDNFSPDNAYFIVEKEGNVLRIFETTNKNAQCYKKLRLLAETETTLSDEYYMGFAATKGEGASGGADAGWLGLESINRGTEQSYVWNMNYGLDWLWQTQDHKILEPMWTTENVGNNETGKMKISPNAVDENYVEGYVRHEYEVSQGFVDNSFDVLITGEKPAVDFYFQTDLGSAYKVAFNNDGTVSFGSEKAERFNYSTGSWYRVNITSKVGENKANIKLLNLNDEVLTLKDDVVAEKFETVLHAKTKQPIKQGFFIKPIKDSEGTYYIDNVYVSLNEKSSLESAVAKAKGLNKDDYSVKSWVIFSDALKEAESVLAKEDASKEEIMTAAIKLEDAINNLISVVEIIKGETKFWNFGDKQFLDLGSSITGTHSFEELTLEFSNEASLRSGGKNFNDGTSFSHNMQNKAGNHFKIKVNGKADIKVYAVSAKSSATRNLVITDGSNTQKYALTGVTNVSEYNYPGPGPATIDIYGEDTLNYYGIKYTPYIKYEDTTSIISYDKTSGLARVCYIGADDLKKAAIGVIVTDNDGKIVEVKKQEFDVAKPKTVQEVQVGAVSKEGNVKVFLWESLNNMKPLCEALEVK